jgi:hypothetical protein
MAGNDREWAVEIAVDHVKISPAYAAGADLDE